MADRSNYDQADALAKAIESRLAQLGAEWDIAKHMIEEQLRQLNHDQNSLRAVLMCILDELEAADAAIAKVTKGPPRKT